MTVQEFNVLADEWERDSRGSSRILTDHPAYRKIVDGGWESVPYMLAELEKDESRHWFSALCEITGENPIPEKDYGRVQKMREHWVEWGRSFVMWKCLICEQEVEIVHPGIDARSIWPNIVGGHVEVTFGYGSIFDQIQSDRSDDVYQGCICDNCTKKKGKLLRRVRAERSTKWEVLPNELGI